MLGEVGSCGERGGGEGVGRTVVGREEGAVVG